VRRENLRENGASRYNRAPAAIPPAAVDDRLLNASEVAALLNVDESWVRQATRSGAMPVVPLGRWKRYRQSSIVAWVESLEQPGRPITLRRHSVRVP
jgi:hypothetical protein